MKYEGKKKCETQVAYPSDNASVHIIAHVLSQVGKTCPLLQYGQRIQRVPFAIKGSFNFVFVRN